jgi:hypothetical protein
MPGNVAERIDFKGFLLSAIAASGLVFGLSVVSLPALPPIVGVLTLLLGGCSGLLYFLHARRARHPLLELRLFANPVFRSAIAAGSLFRIGAGATPFLLPLMLQVGFGLTPFRSGLITFASAIGALAMKFVARPIIRAGGFRTVLAVGAVAGGLLIGANGLFTASTSHAVIIAILVGGGFLRSLFFTSANALVFADVTDDQTSQATAIAAVTQQVSIALGVAVAGGILELTTTLSGRPLDAWTFSIAFFSVAAIALFALVPILALARDAGATVSGHRIRVVGPFGRTQAEPTE